MASLAEKRVEHIEDIEVESEQPNARPEELRLLEALLFASTEPLDQAALAKRIEAWQKTAARYDDEPETGEGRKQLAERAKHAEHGRDLAMAKYHHFEIASAAFQIAIVLASATIITGIVALSWGAGLLALAGIAFTAIGIFAPHAVHLM